MPWDFALIFVVLGVLVPWRGAVRVRKLLQRPALSSADRMRLYVSTIVVQWVASAFVLWRAFARRIDAAALGLALPEPGLTVAVAFVLCLALAAAQLLSLRRMARLPVERQGFVGQLARKLLPQNPRETAVFTALAATVALCEEFLYRGFVFAVMESVAGSAAFAAFASSLFFAAAHLYQGRRGVVTTFAAGLLFAAARILTGSLLASVAAHFVADALAGRAASRFLRPAPAAGGQAMK